MIKQRYIVHKFYHGKELVGEAIELGGALVAMQPESTRSWLAWGSNKLVETMDHIFNQEHIGRRQGVVSLASWYKFYGATKVTRTIMEGVVNG